MSLSNKVPALKNKKFIFNCFEYSKYDFLNFINTWIWIKYIIIPAGKVFSNEIIAKLQTKLRSCLKILQSSWKQK